MYGIVYQKQDYKIINVIENAQSCSIDTLICDNATITIDTEILAILITEKTFKIDDYLDINIELNLLKERKVQEINNICNENILYGFKSSAKDGEHHYDFSYDHQINMSSIQNRIVKDLIMKGSFNDKIEWKNSEQTEVDNTWTVSEFMQLCNDAESFKAVNIKKYYKIKKMILDSITKSELNNITWNIEV